MWQSIRFFLHALFTVAVAILVIHVQQIWYNHDQGWAQAWNIEYTKAGNIMTLAIVIILVVVLLEIFYWRKKDKEAREYIKSQREDSKLLRNIAKKLGIDEDESKDTNPNLKK